MAQSTAGIHQAHAPVGLVPWRTPAQDLARFFPGATGYRPRTRILSHRRLSLARQLGHAPSGEDLLLRHYEVTRAGRSIGFVVVRRVKGEYGAIEFVLAVSPALRIHGMRLQRLREPVPIERALTDARWLGAFTGKRAGDRWRLGDDVLDVSAVGRLSARAIVDGVRTALILLREAESEKRS